ncbi:hypothetical protein AVEN_218203-1 [Araneus ventricosus]|uniref:Uncharacterized protein n=1 Tax=Araneus ventricosus TaxID=182803 RepID=A0A4Y2F441_ARAVE|nr:hypothetical protein AVEN_218203-1 [Araneus ventricosus]
MQSCLWGRKKVKIHPFPCTTPVSPKRRKQTGEGCIQMNGKAYQELRSMSRLRFRRFAFGKGGSVEKKEEQVGDRLKRSEMRTAAQIDRARPLSLEG